MIMALIRNFSFLAARLMLCGGSGVGYLVKLRFGGILSVCGRESVLGLGLSTGICLKACLTISHEFTTNSLHTFSPLIAYKTQLIFQSHKFPPIYLRKVSKFKLFSQ